MTIGGKIKELRIAKGLTQEDLAKKCDLNRNSIYRYEKDETMPRMPQIKAIATALDVSLDYLMYGEFQTDTARLGEIMPLQSVGQYTQPIGIIKDNNVSALDEFIIKLETIPELEKKTRDLKGETANQYRDNILQMAEKATENLQELKKLRAELGDEVLEAIFKKVMEDKNKEGE